MAIEIEKLPVGELFLYQIRELLKQLVKPGSGSALAYPANTNYIQVMRYTITAANFPYKGPEMTIPDGFNLVIKAAPTNAIGAYIFVGETAAACLNINSSWPLVPNETISYAVKNANKIYVSGSVGDAVLFTAEKPEA